MKAMERILLIDDDELIASMLARFLSGCGYETRFETEAGDILATIERWYPDIILLDISLPGQDGMAILKEVIDRGIETKVIMLTADNTAEMAIKALKLGAVDYITKPFNSDEVQIVVSNVIERMRLRDEVDGLRRDRKQADDRVIIATSDAFTRVMAQAASLAQAKVKTILITGESGTGKELMARHIHRLSHDQRTDPHAPFITLNCTALPEHLFESELFGYVKGAFTDAKTDSKGLFELADGGSILLDEIGDIKDGLQAKLLRVLEERRIRRVGGKADLPINVTVIATTNRDLRAAISEGKFRMDLFYRLNTFPLHLPPLRERKECVPLLANHFLALFAKKYNRSLTKAFSPEALALLSAYPWPGNVRELKNMVERLIVLEPAPCILPEHLPVNMQGPRSQPAFVERRKSGCPFVLPDTGIDMMAFEKELFLQAWTKSEHNMAKAAKLLSISYDSFRNHSKKYQLK